MGVEGVDKTLGSDISSLVQDTPIPPPFQDKPYEDAPLKGRQYENMMKEIAERGFFEGGEFENLVYYRFYARIYHIGLGVTKNEADAKDAAQKTLIKISESIGQFSGRSRFGTWLYRIAYNYSLMLLRERDGAFRLEMVKDGDGSFRYSAEPIEYHTPESALGMIEDHEKLESAIGRMNGRNKTIILLYLRGHTCRQIAKKTRVPLGTAKSIIHRTKHKLKHELAYNHFV